MAEQEEDFSSLPLPDRFAHKVCHCACITLDGKLYLLLNHRIGKFGSKVMKMLQRRLKTRQTNQIPYLDLLYSILDYGRELSRTRMLRRNKKESTRYVTFSSLVELKRAQGQWI
jgi:hypothetical protein